MRLFVQSGIEKFVTVELFALKRYDRSVRVAKFLRTARVGHFDAARIKGACVHKISHDVLTAIVPWHLREAAF